MRGLESGLRIEPGAELGPRYKIESLLGKGGMGAVYRAFDAELGRTVALKLIRTDLANNPESMKRFKQELLLASRISHKNILRIHDLMEVEGTRFISMAFIDGEDLHCLLAREGRLPFDRIVGMARQLCAALDAAHAEGIIHRDLKPQNVMMDREGNAFISDFGLAKSLEAGAAKMTHTGELLGTPRYMSPEQVQGKQADRRSDLYSLGLIFYEMATGEVPFASDSIYQTMYLRTKESPKDPKLLNPELPDFLARIIMRCLEADPARRYQSAREILQDLEAAQAPPRSVRISAPGIGPRKWILGTCVFVLLAALGLLFPRVREFVAPQLSRTRMFANGSPANAGRTYIAVLPFRVLGDVTSLGYIAEGLREALTAKLFQLKTVYIPSVRDAEKAAGEGSPDKIARSLGVRFVLHGTVAKAGEKVAIIVNLEDIDKGQRLWAKEYSCLVQDQLTLEDQIYNELLAVLRLTPDTEERARTATHSTEKTEAYDLYLKGRNSLRGQQDVSNLKAAIAYFEGAAKVDAGFALAYVGLSDANLAMYRATKDNVWAQKALAAGEQAQRLNDQLPEVCLSLGNVYNATGKSSEAVAVLSRALELAPNSDEGYRRLGETYARTGRKDEAIQAYRKAIEINPYYWFNYSALGGAYFNMGKFDEALKAYRRITELEPQNAWGHLNVGAVFFSQGKYEECIPAFKKALEIKASWQTYSNLGTAYFYLKRYPEAVGAFEKAVEMSPNQEVAVGNLADAYRWSGLPGKASATYDKAITLAYKELEVNPRNAASMSSLALYYAKKGNATRAAEFIRRARSIEESNVEFIYNEAVIRALAGQNQDAIKALRLAFKNGLAVQDAESNPELASLQVLPEFKQLLAELVQSDARQK
jgi:tetratricopeptide (TPR) repeat protein